MTTEKTETRVIARGEGTLTVSVTYTPRSGRPLRLYRLKIEVTATTGERSSKVFVYRRATGGPPMEDGSPRDEFMCVADDLDEDEIPVDAPALAQGIPYYRVSSVELLFRNADQMYEAAHAIMRSLNS